MASPTAYVHLGYGFDADRYRAEFDRDNAPDESPYGFHHARSMGWAITFSSDHAESAVANRARRILNRAFGFDLVHLYRNRRKLAAADVVWTMTEREYLAVAAFGLMAEWRRPLVGQTIWLFDQWATYSPVRRRVLRWLIRRVDVLTVHSTRYLDVVPQLVPGRAARLVHFGIPPQPYPPSAKPLAGRPRRVLTMGNDPTRDWPTFLAAFGNDDRFDLRIVCAWLGDDVAGRYRNLTVPRYPRASGFRDLYAWADVVVVPMTPNGYSGITVALEAAGSGVPVVATDTGGIGTYFAAGEVRLVPPGDADALRQAVVDLDPDAAAAMAGRARARFESSGYTAERMAAEYVAISRELGKRRPEPF